MNLGALPSRPGSTSNSSIFIRVGLSFLTWFSQFRVNISLANRVPTPLRSSNCGCGLIVRSIFGVRGVIGGCISRSAAFPLTSRNFLFSSIRLATIVLTIDTSVFTLSIFEQSFGKCLSMTLMTAIPTISSATSWGIYSIICSSSSKKDSDFICCRIGVLETPQLVIVLGPGVIALPFPFFFFGFFVPPEAQIGSIGEATVSLSLLKS